MNIKIDYNLSQGCVSKAIEVTKKGKKETKVLKSTAKVAFIYATIKAYPEGLTLSQCNQLDLDTGEIGLKRAVQLGVVKQEGAYYKAVEFDTGLSAVEVPVETAILKADESALTRAEKEYYFWVLSELHGRDNNKSLEDSVVFGTKLDIIRKTRGTYTDKKTGVVKRTFQDQVQEAIAKLDKLRSKGLLFTVTTSKQQVTAVDITEANKYDQIAFKVGTVGANTSQFPETVFNATRTVGNPKAQETPEPRVSDFF